MIKKYIFLVLATFSLSAVAGMHDGGSHMSDMAKDSDVGLGGAFELKYKALGENVGDSDDGAPALSYRWRLNWSGEVNEEVNWKVGLSSSKELELTAGPKNVTFEQAYVSYKPFFAEGLSVTVGKKEWKPKFGNTGVLYDDDHYFFRASVKYHYGDDDWRVYAKLKYYELNESLRGPFKSERVVKAKVWGHYSFFDQATLKAYLSAELGLPSELSSFSLTEEVALAQVGAKLDVPDVIAEEVPFGFFGAYLTNVQGIADSHSFHGGAYVGRAGSPYSTKRNDFGLAVNYYNLNKADFNTKLVDTDYVWSSKEAGGRDSEGVAVRAQYNVWENINAVVKYAYDLNPPSEESDPHNLVGELTFLF